MKLISWNCNRAFRQKYFCLESYCADIIVAPESESPQKLAKFRSCIPESIARRKTDRNIR